MLKHDVSYYNELMAKSQRTERPVGWKTGQDYEFHSDTEQEKEERNSDKSDRSDGQGSYRKWHHSRDRGGGKSTGKDKQQGNPSKKYWDGKHNKDYNSGYGSSGGYGSTSYGSGDYSSAREERPSDKCSRGDKRDKGGVRKDRDEREPAKVELKPNGDAHSRVDRDIDKVEQYLWEHERKNKAFREEQREMLTLVHKRLPSCCAFMGRLVQLPFTF